MSSSLSQQQQQQDDGVTVSNEAPAFLSRQQVAHLRAALALVVMRQRCRQKRKTAATATAEQQQQGDDDETSNRQQQQQQQQQQAAPQQVPMTKRTRLCPQENVSAIATTISTTTSTRQHVHYMMETAVTQVLHGATSNNNNDNNSRQPQGLLVHLAQTWQAWAVQDPTQAAALCQSLLLQQQQQQTTRMAALCSVYKNILLLGASRASQQPLVQVWQDSVQHVLRAALRQTTNDNDTYITTTTTTTTIGMESLSPHVSLDVLLPLVSFYEFCLQQQSNATTSTSTNPSRQPHDHATTNALPSMGLLPTDVYTHWISLGGGGTTTTTTTTAALSRVVDALWMRHAVGTARQRAALVRYVATLSY